MAIHFTVGHYIVNEASEVTRCPSYYAADHETLRLKPGRYPVRVMVEGQELFKNGVDGKWCPVPRWLLVGVASERVSGRLYNGFGGVNYSSTELPAGEAVEYGLQFNPYQIAGLIAAGKVEPLPGMESVCAGMADNHYDLARQWTFEQVSGFPEATCPRRLGRGW